MRIDVCSNDWYLPGTSGVFTSMDSDNNGLYDSNLYCSWIIKAEEGQIAKLLILSMDIEESLLCLHDYLSVSKLLVYGNIC